MPMPLATVAAGERGRAGRRWLVPLFFGLVLLLGLSVHRDYGLSIDENQSRDNGMITLKHVAQRLNPAWVAAQPFLGRYNVPLSEYFDRDYGVAFETPVCWLELLLGIEGDGEVFLFRHLCTFLVCFGGLIAVYQLAARRFADWRLGLLAAAWLLLSPRLFAESFYNDKDAVFMALFAIATNTGVRLLLRPTAGRALWHALACAITIDVRIMGVILPLLTVGMLFWRGLHREVSWKRVAATAALYSTVLAGLVVLFWPYLWPAPLTNFLLAFEKMSQFRWPGSVLYFGKFESAGGLPWHYAPVWLGITTPLLYLAAGLLGIVAVLRQLVRQRWRLWGNEGELQDGLFLALFAGPLLAVIGLHSVLYDGWRQLYFIYPAFLLLALRGWQVAARWRPRRWLTPRRWPRLFYGATALAMLVTLGQMVRDHPLQNVYFNLLAGPNVGQRFELDYWGLGYRQSVEYIAEHDMRPRIKIFSPPPSTADFNRQLLPAYHRDRIVSVENPDSADYFITNYRWHPQPYPYPHEVYQLRADGRRIYSIFRLRW